MSTRSGSTTPKVDRIADLIVKLLGTRSLADARRVLLDNPELLSDMAVALLSALRQQTGGLTNRDEAAHIEMHERLIRRSREVGVTAAAEEAASGLPHSPLSALVEEAATISLLPADPVRLDQLVARLVAAADQSRDDPPEMRAAVLYEAGRLALRRQMERGSDVSRDEAITLLRRAADASPPDTPIRARCLAELASALLDHYRSANEANTLDEALKVFEAALSSSPPSYPDWEAATLSNYAAALLERYLRDGRVDDLEHATEGAMASVRVSEPSTSEFASRLINFAALLTYRYRRTGLLADLDTAVDAIERALKMDLPAESAAAARTNLGNVLRERYALLRDAEDLHQAMTAYERAFDLTPADGPDYPDRLTNLGALYADRFLLTGDGQDLDFALTLGRDAVQKTPEASPELVARLGNYALALKLRYEFRGEQADQSAAIGAYRRATALGKKNHSPVAVLIASQWGGWATARGQWPEADNAYRDALSILEGLLQRTGGWRDRVGYLSASKGVTENAAHAFMRSGNARDAAVTLERGRTRLLDEALARYAPELAALSEAGKDSLVLDFRAAVQRSLMAELKPSQRPAGISQEPDAGTTVAGCLEAIRDVPSLRRFLRPVDYARVAKAAHRAPLVYLAAAQRGGLALIVRESASDPQDLALPELTEAGLRERISTYMSAYDNRSSGAAARQAWQAVNDATLGWLWDTVMESLVAALPEPRAVLLPMGLLSMFPLHAAWTTDASGPRGRRYVLDSHLITYASNARSLPVTRMPVRREADRAVVISQASGSRGGDTRPGVEIAHDSAVRWFGEVTELRGPRAHRRAVFAALESHDVAHFACPTHTDLVDPLTTCLTVGAGERLTVRSLVSGPGLKTSIAVVPAGQSSLPGAELPNELISIPTGLHAAGVPAVVACLWEVDDLSARILIEKFYAYWRGQEMEPADALRAAQIWLRDVSREEVGEVIHADPVTRPDSMAPSRTGGDRPFSHPMHWAGFVYSGA